MRRCLCRDRGVYGGAFAATPVFAVSFSHDQMLMARPLGQVPDHDPGLERHRQRSRRAQDDEPGGRGDQVNHLRVTRPLRGGGIGAVVAAAGPAGRE